LTANLAKVYSVHGRGIWLRQQLLESLPASFNASSNFVVFF